MVEEGTRCSEYRVVCMMQCLHFEEKIAGCKSASFLHRNHSIISNNDPTNTIVQNGNSAQSIQRNYLQIIVHAFQREDHQLKIGILPAQKLFHHFEQCIKPIAQNGISDHTHILALLS
jgi:hypothetical protein